MPILPTASGNPVDEDNQRKEREEKGRKAQASATIAGGMNAKEVRREEELQQATTGEKKKMKRVETGVANLSISPTRKEQKRAEVKRQAERDRVGGELGEALEKILFGKEQ